MPADYSKGQIYVIRAPGTDRIYIGSTTMPLESRLAKHNYDYLKGAGGKCSSKEIVCIPGHTIELLEAYPCATVQELRRREGWHIRQNADKVVNKNIAGRSPQEYIAENAETYRQQALAWYYNNIPRRREYEAKNYSKIRAYQKQYYETVLKARRAEEVAARKAEREALRAAKAAAKEQEVAARRAAKAAVREQRLKQIQDAIAARKAAKAAAKAVPKPVTPLITVTSGVLALGE